MMYVRKGHTHEDMFLLHICAFDGLFMLCVCVVACIWVDLFKYHSVGHIPLVLVACIDALMWETSGK